MSMRNALTSVLCVFGVLLAAPVADAETPGDLVWVKQAGGESHDLAAAVAAFPDGSSIVTGGFAGTATFGAGERNETILVSGPNPSNRDLFVARYDADGSLAWAKRAGGLGTSTPRDVAGPGGVAVFADGSCVVVGGFVGSVTFGPGEPNATTLLCGVYGYDAFVARYNADGSLAWVRRTRGDNTWAAGNAVGTLPDGACVVSGAFYATVTFGEGEEALTLASDPTAAYDLFVARFDPDGSVVWATRAGGVGEDGPAAGTSALGALPDGSCIVTGEFTGNITFGEGEGNETTLAWSGQGYDLFVARYEADGSLAWARRAGPREGEDGYKVAGIPLGASAFPDGSSVLTGSFAGTFTFGEGDPNETTLINDGPYVASFVARYNADGSLAWARQPGGVAWEPAVGAFADGSSVMAGTFHGNVTFGAGGPNETTLVCDAYDLFVARYDADGALASAKRATVAGAESGTAGYNARAFSVGAFPDGSYVVAGSFYGSVMFGQGEPNETTLVSPSHFTLNRDVFLARFAGEIVVPVPPGSDVSETLPVVLPDGTEVPVTISFDNVTQGGAVSVTTDDRQSPPSGFKVDGVYYEVTTTTQFTGSIGLCFTWAEGDVKNENHLKLLHFENGVWEDVTTSRDTEANTICGMVSSLSMFVLAETEPVLGDFLPPVNADGSSVFKAGSTVPLRFQIRDSAGAIVGDAVARLRVWQVSSQVTGTVEEEIPAESAGEANDGDLFRFDAEDGEYVFNLKTKGWAKGTYRAEALVDGYWAHAVIFSLRE